MQWQLLVQLLFDTIQLLFVHHFLEEFDINDDEIIALVQGTAEEACDSNDDLYLLPVSNKTALESVENILSYLQQQNEFSIDCSLVLKIRDLRNQMREKQINSMKQTTLDSLFTIIRLGHVFSISRSSIGINVSSELYIYRENPLNAHPLNARFGTVPSLGLSIYYYFQMHVINNFIDQSYYYYYSL